MGKMGMAVTNQLEATEGQRLLDEMTDIASRACAAILAVQVPDLALRDKADRSPVTAADEASEAVVIEGLKRLLPGTTIVSEESGQSVPGALSDRFLMVDPLDGTREFLAGEDEYTVNIALIIGGVPILGVVAAPALGMVWRGIVGHGAERLRLTPGAPLSNASERTAISGRTRPARGLIALRSRFHHAPETDVFLDRLPDVHRAIVGSSVKFCRLAEGKADLYARMSPMSEWDIAAGHAVLSAAGGVMTTTDGKPLLYGQAGFKVPGFIAWADGAAAG